MLLPRFCSSYEQLEQCPRSSVGNERRTVNPCVEGSSPSVGVQFLPIYQVVEKVLDFADIVVMNFTTKIRFQ